MENFEDKILDNKSRSEIPVEIFSGTNPPESKWKMFFRNKAVVFSTIFALLFIFLIGWYFLFGGKKQVNPISNNVVLQILGPDQLVSGNEAEYHVNYHNGENADLVGVSLEMFYPSGFTFKSAQPTATSSAGTVYNLPMVKSGQNSEVVIRGKLIGSTSEAKQIKAVLHYRLSNFNSDFAASQTLSTSILPPNLVMDLNGPVDVVNGQDTTFILNLTNVTNQDFVQLALQLTYPDGFSFTSSNPPASKNNNYWSLANLAQNTSTTIEITGSFVGNDAETKLVKADMGQIVNNVFAPQLTSTATFVIIASALNITLACDAKNGIVNLGDTVNYTLKYGNQGGIGLNNLVIVVNLDGPALDFAHLTAENAIVTGRTLTWKSATLPVLNVLSPNEKGEIHFSVPIMENLTTNLKNQIIKASSMISADEISKTTKAADVSLKLGSQINLAISGNYVSGAVPMQIGKTTLLAMTLSLSNLSNDLSNTKVVTSLPLPSAAWKNVIIPDVEKNRLSFDSNSGKITWSIGDLAAFTGKFIPALKVTFQLQISPTEVDRNKVVNLLSKAQATGTDTFTGFSISSDIINNISVSDLNDPTFNAKGTTVQ